MSKVIIHTESAPAAVGPYSQAIQHGNFVFTSGQIPLDANTGAIVGDDVQTQARQVLEHLTTVLKAAGCTLEQVVKNHMFSC